MNHTMIAGRLGADPDVRFTSGGQKVTSLRVATNRRRKGEEQTVWYRVTLWGESFDKMLTYLKKGSAIMAWGDLEAELYTNREGQQAVSLNLTATNISFSPFGGKQDSGQQGQQQQQQQQQPAANQMMPGQGQEMPKESFDEIPF